MPHNIAGDTNFDIPERDDVGSGQFVDQDNDYVVMSRLDHLVDRTDAIGPFNMLPINDVSEAREQFDSEKDDYGNNGITRLDVVTRSDRW